MHKPDPRLDLLIYAHDGRGLGHVSRSIAIGSAMRRMYPEMKILMLTGSRYCSRLVDRIDLDWLKLPSYVKKTVAGRTKSVVGATGLKNSYLAASRARLIREIIREYRPRCVLVDHEVRGKRNELVLSMEENPDICWLVGVRGIVGQVDDFWDEAARLCYRDYFRDILWYGDSSLVGRETIKRITAFYGHLPHETGYVSRLLETRHWQPEDRVVGREFAGTIAISWLTRDDKGLLKRIRGVLEKIGDRYGRWQLFLVRGRELFEDLPFCDLHRPGPHYLYTLPRSRVAMVHGGYNSITDLLATGTPAILLMRSFDDEEQQQHVSRLAAMRPEGFHAMAEEQFEVDEVAAAMLKLLEREPSKEWAEINGAEKASQRIAAHIRGVL